MRDYEMSIRKELGVRPPSCYLDLLKHHGDRFPEDPVTEASWIPGLGNVAFVVGTTQSFRAAFPSLPEEYIVIGYAGRKTIQKLGEDIDVYVMLNTKDKSVALIDSLGKWETVSPNFHEWIASNLARALLRTKYHGHLVVIEMRYEKEAEELTRQLRDLEQERRLKVTDMATVMRKGDGSFEVRHHHEVSGKGVTTGGLAGLLLGTLMSHPLLGAAVGAAAGAASSALPALLDHVGIENDFLRELSCMLTPGAAALFVLVEEAESRPVLERIKGLGGKVLITTLSPRAELTLQAALNGESPETP